jgi:hypothetical protein
MAALKWGGSQSAKRVSGRKEEVKAANNGDVG